MTRPCAIVIGVVALVNVACSSATSPTELAASSLQIAPPSPATGATIRVTVGAAPGFFIPRGSAQIAIPITVTSGQQLPWAQLFVYLMTSDSPQNYCGQNLPDAPGWEPFVKGQTASVMITGFQVYRLPCDVSEIRAYLTTRDIRHGGSLSPPTPTE